MNPIYNEYLTFLRNTTNQPLEDLKEGYFWLDRSIIKGFDKHGNEHKFYRIKIENTLESVIYLKFLINKIRSIISIILLMRHIPMNDIEDSLVYVYILLFRNNKEPFHYETALNYY